jgi:vitamin B12/bleomycin/antimicrobial peptide transport system ATP-binding/permease protein
MAVPDGKKDVRHVIGAALKGVIAIWRIYRSQLMRMTLVTYTSLLVTPVIGLLLCIPKYLAETMTLGEVVQVSAAFVVVQGAFGWFTDNYAHLAEWASSANRVASLLLALDEVDLSNARLAGGVAEVVPGAFGEQPTRAPRDAGRQKSRDSNKRRDK